ncbi:hypothetical protein LLG95_14790, partial [bacterium]|nr:hypothetical protein [bacterium]
MDSNVGPPKLGKFVGFLFLLCCLAAAGYLFKGVLLPQRGANRGPQVTVNEPNVQTQETTEAPKPA